MCILSFFYPQPGGRDLVHWISKSLVFPFSRQEYLTREIRSSEKKILLGSIPTRVLRRNIYSPLFESCEGEAKSVWTQFEISPSFRPICIQIGLDDNSPQFQMTMSCQKTCYQSKFPSIHCQKGTSLTIRRYAYKVVCDILRCDDTLFSNLSMPETIRLLECKLGT